MKNMLRASGDQRTRGGRWQRMPGPIRAPLLAVMILIGTTGLVLTPATAAAQDVGLPLGTIPEAAEVEDLDGSAVDVSSLIRGRPTLIEFWATWCPLCEALDPRLQAAKQEFGDRVDFIVIGVAVNQTPRRIQRHIEDHPTVGPVYYDRRGAAVRAYRAPTTSYVVILDAAGRVAYTGTGGDQPIAEKLASILGG
jgi:thiol-disulfide isomerase/thioredoxin